MVSIFEDSGNREDVALPPLNDDEVEPSFLDEYMASTFVNSIAKEDAHSDEQQTSDYQEQDNLSAVLQPGAKEESRNSLLDKSLLPNVEVNSQHNNDEDLVFLDPTRLSSTIDNFVEVSSSAPTAGHGHLIEDPNGLESNDERVHMQLESSEDLLSSQIHSAAEEEHGYMKSIVEMDTEEIYKYIASLDLTTLKDPPVYFKESVAGNPDPIISTLETQDAESDSESQVEIQPLEDAIQSRQEDGPLKYEESAFELGDDAGDPICTVSIPVNGSKGELQSLHEDRKHEGEHHGDSGCICDDRTGRQEAWNSAGDVLQTFGLAEKSKPHEETCTGHKETIFGVAFSECGAFCATASQDASIKVWDVETNILLASLEGHSTEFECLRVAWASPSWSSNLLDRISYKYLLASSGADGTVRLWGCLDPKTPKGQEGGWRCYLTLDHSQFALKTSTDKQNTGDKPQVYALQFIDHWEAFDNSGENSPSTFLMTSSDDYLHFWTLNGPSSSDQCMTLDGPMSADRLSLKEVISLHFGSIRQYGYGVSVANVTEPEHDSSTSNSARTKVDGSDSRGATFGGERNPKNLIYVFDASFCSSNGLVGVALSDGTLRLINGRGICVCILNGTNSKSHLTSFAWDRMGQRLVSTVATGHLVSWQLRSHDGQESGYTKADQVCTFEGGHEAGRPLFGARFYGLETEDLILSWSADGSLCLWDSQAQGHVESPLAVLRKYHHSAVYAVEVHPNQTIAVGGVESDRCSHGVPLYLYKPKDQDSNG